MFLIWSIPPPSASRYHWRSTSSPEENNFIHWLHLILHSTVKRVDVEKGGQQALFSLLQASSQQAKKHLFNVWKKGGVEFWAAAALRQRQPKSVSIVWHWREGDGGVKDLSHREVSLSGFSKWLPLGVESSLTSAIITPVYLLMKDWW